MAPPIDSRQVKQPAGRGLPEEAPRLGTASPPAPRLGEQDGEAIGPCPNCGAPMNAIRGSKSAICSNCGFKDSCCF